MTPAGKIFVLVAWCVVLYFLFFPDARADASQWWARRHGKSGYLELLSPVLVVINKVLKKIARWL